MTTTATTDWEPQPAFVGSGIWYCRVHSGTVNEDEGHDTDDRCPWHEHDDDRCADPVHDPDPDYEWCDGVCSPCDWVELLVPRTVGNGRTHFIDCPAFDGGRCTCNGSDEPPPCICGHAKSDHLGRQDDCTVKGCPCPLYTLGNGSRSAS